MRADKIFLVGFMAAGKSTVAKALAHKLDWRVEDSDALIEKRERKTVADIFDRHGELYFRTSERAVIQELAPLQHVVIATGGGTFTIQENRTVINQIGVSVWLDVSFNTVLERLPTDGRRPLAKNQTAMRALYDSRQPAYRYAHLRIDANELVTEELVKQIMEWMAA